MRNAQVKIRSIIYVVAALLIGVLVVANWSVLSATVSLNLLFASVQAPLVVLLLASMAVLLLAALIALAMSSRAWNVERRRLVAELDVTRARAEKEEASRTQALRTTVESEFSAVRLQLERLLAGQSALLGRASSSAPAVVAELPEAPQTLEPELIPPRTPVRGRH